MRENRDKWGNWLPEVAAQRRLASKVARARERAATFAKKVGAGGRTHSPGAARKRREKIAIARETADHVFQGAHPAHSLQLAHEAEWKMAMERSDPKVQDTHGHVRRNWQLRKYGETIEPQRQLNERDAA